MQCEQTTQGCHRHHPQNKKHQSQFLKLKKQGWKDLKEYKYALALEHVNSIQNLVRIAEFFGIKYPTEISMWPLGGKIISGNMQTVVSIRK